MENKEPLFDFLEDVVGQLEVKPTEQARELHLQAMNQLLKEQAQQQRKSRLLKGLGGALLLAILLSGIMWLMLPQSNKTTNTLSNNALKSSPTAPYSTVAIPTYPKSDIPETAKTIAAAQSTPQTKATQARSTATANNPKLPATSQNNNQLPQKQNIAKNETQIAGISSLPMLEARLQIKRKSLAVNKDSKTTLSTVKYLVKDTLILQKTTQSKAKPSFTDFELGVHYTPEFMFNTLDQSNKIVNNAGLEITWVKGPYSIRSGIGISVATGVTALSYDYNDYLGMSKKLDSVSFSYDANAREIVPSWFFSDKNVYDTAMLSLINEITKRYTYLQFPLILGYDFHQGDKLCFGFRAGPVLQVLVKEEQLNQDPGAGDNLVISKNQLTPDRMASHWQALLGFNSSLRLSKRLKLELEPHLKYYFNSVYEKTSTTSKPWSVELRTALIIKL